MTTTTLKRQIKADAPSVRELERLTAPPSLTDLARIGIMHTKPTTGWGYGGRACLLGATVLAARAGEWI